MRLWYDTTIKCTCQTYQKYGENIWMSILCQIELLIVKIIKKKLQFCYQSSLCGTYRSIGGKPCHLTTKLPPTPHSQWMRSDASLETNTFPSLSLPTDQRNSSIPLHTAVFWCVFNSSVAIFVRRVCPCNYSGNCPFWLNVSLLYLNIIVSHAWQ